MPASSRDARAMMASRSGPSAKTPRLLSALDQTTNLNARQRRLNPVLGAKSKMKSGKTFCCESSPIPGAVRRRNGGRGRALLLCFTPSPGEHRGDRPTADRLHRCRFDGQRRCQSSCSVRRHRGGLRRRLTACRAGQERRGDRKGQSGRLRRLPSGARAARYRRRQRGDARPLAREDRRSRPSRPASTCFARSR